MGNYVPCCVVDRSHVPLLQNTLKNRVFGGILNSKLNFGKLGSILSFSVSLYLKNLKACYGMPPFFLGSLMRSFRLGTKPHTLHLGPL